MKGRRLKETKSLRANEITGSISQRNVLRKVERLAPIDDLTICVVRIFGTERGPADQTLEHDGSNRPPVTAECVAFAGEDLGRNVIGRSNGRVGHDST